MPIYEYQCRACAHRLETLQKISDEPLTRCPACGEEELGKLISAAAFRLSGSGWYETDFKKGSKKNLAGDKQPETDKSSTGSKAEPSGQSGKSGKSETSGKSTNAPAST